MTDDKNDGTARSDHDASFQRSLRNKGFEPGEPVHEYSSCFTAEQAQASLFASTYSTPIPVFLTGEDDGVRRPVVLDHARPVYAPYGSEAGTTSPGCFEAPDWMFTGWIMPSGYSSTTAIIRVRIWVDSDFDAMFLWQVISTPDPNQEEIQVISG